MNLGINIETGDALIMNENLAETFAFAMRYKRLFHTHWHAVIVIHLGIVVPR